MANMRAQLFSLGAAEYSVRVSGGGDGSPAPLNLGPLDASDALFAKLIGWTEVFAEEFDVRAPTFPTWANGREVQGSKPVTVEAAHDLAARMTGWLTDRLDEIAGSRGAVAFHDDLIYGHEDARGVHTLCAMYGVEPRPIRQADKRECPVCGAHDVFAKLPDTLNPEYSIMCDRCKWIEEPEKVAKTSARLFG
ncbi:hypothetical protein QMG61_05325 [Cryobacterium sp. PH31-AA6]|uniref:hypothetical protein n=1 Tax=Cryobacterium sp. PH31-AA6 TaxID=3046205 RepID=UPI0024B8D40C|nr:hypothetical protein [Cryobacterium sp. PH31-AA6]MDJ0323183.1 hypothetical protein [Cryobacterium sp. PH31-AA6]